MRDMTDDEIRALLEGATLPDVDYSTLRAEVDERTYPRAARLFMRHHIAHKNEKLVSVLAMHSADMSLKECNGLPHLFAAAPALANAALSARAECDKLQKQIAEDKVEHDHWYKLAQDNLTRAEAAEAELTALRDRLAVVERDNERLEGLMRERMQMLARYNSMLGESSIREEFWKAKYAALQSTKGDGDE